jgi:hypothetical protein
MFRRFWKWILVALAIVVAAIAGTVFYVSSEPIALTSPQIQGFINPKLPFHTRYGVDVSKADIDLSRPGNQAAVHFAMTYDRGGAVYTVAGTAVGTIRYDVGRAAFFVHPTEVHVDDVTRNQTNVGDKVNRVIDLLSRSSEKAEARKEHLRQLADEALQKAVRLAADEVLDHVPVYTLPNNKAGNAARLALNDVQVRDGKLYLYLGSAK